MQKVMLSESLLQAGKKKGWKIEKLLGNVIENFKELY